MARALPWAELRDLSRRRIPLGPDSKGTRAALVFDGLWYWAPAQGGLEVDFLLQRGRQLVAIEVKATSKPQVKDFAGRKAIAELNHVRRRLLVHTGSRAFTTADGVEALSVQDFVRLVESGRL